MVAARGQDGDRSYVHRSVFTHMLHLSISPPLTSLRKDPARELLLQVLDAVADLCVAVIRLFGIHEDRLVGAGPYAQEGFFPLAGVGFAEDLVEIVAYCCFCLLERCHRGGGDAGPAAVQRP